ncbi:MAG: Rieske (2Fe-2S) protein [Myxococcales bacterium]|nr:Rieske (2Fe-2S) protein [Myxococcales bacterium]
MSNSDRSDAPDRDPSVAASETPDSTTKGATPPGGPEAPERRGALKTLAVVGGAAYAGVLAIPGIAFLMPVEQGGGGTERWFRVAQLDSLPEGKPQRFKLKGDLRDAFTVAKDQTIGSVWLTRNGKEVQALSAECPHLGCAIDATADGQAFNCPCHTSRFTLDGKPETGPSPRNMDALATRIADGWVEVDFRRFRQGIADKVEA